MAHWAEIDKDSKVVRVVVTSNDESDEGYQWLIDNLGGTWIKTSYNTYGGVHIKGGTPLRKNYAGVDYTYDSVRDAFIPPKPECHPNDTTLNPDSCIWECSNAEHQIVEE